MAPDARHVVQSFAPSAVLGATALELAAFVARGQLSPPEVVEAALRAAADERLNALITVRDERALEDARAVGARLPLAGVPVVVKDVIDTAHVRTTYGSRVYAEHVPVSSAPVVTALEHAGAVVIAKANTDEFAWGTTSQNPHYGTVENPAHPGRVAGGSSGGSAAALAGGLCALALGTDTGGSVRVPAACCGVVGFKPSRAALSREGVFPLASSFDAVGLMARTVCDCALMHAVLARTTIPEPSVAGIVLGVMETSPPGAVALLEGLGAGVRAYGLPASPADAYACFAWECARSHAAIFPARRALYGPVARAKWERAFGVGPEAALAARAALAEWRHVIASELAADVLITPTLGIPLPPSDCHEPEVSAGLTHYTRPYNYLDWPALAIGDLQIAGPDARKVLAVALAYEAAGGQVVAPRLSP